MDLSINKINALNKGKINFKGLKGEINSKNKLVYRFTLPPHKPNEKAFLEIMPMSKNKAGLFGDIKKENFILVPFENSENLDIMQDVLKEFGSGFAYRYKFVSDKETRYALDEHKKINIKDTKGKTTQANIHEGFYSAPKTGTMRHSFVDSDVILKAGKPMPEADFVRNHFNKLGGSIEGLNYLLQNTNELDHYRYVISTPDIGVDKISSHKYWPNNQYQCNDLNAFLEFNSNLFKKGKGYVADGAFTSQGIQSPLVQHVLKWGEDSPFYNMLKINGYITLGLLPDVDHTDIINPMDYFGVKLINNPKTKGYNPDKPTFIQFFDNRMVTKEQLEDDSIITEYKSKPQTHYDIVTFKDSIQPYYFEIDPSDIKIKENFSNGNVVMLNDIPDLGNFLTFKNFSIGKISKASGAAFWSGNVDIIKMNLSNPTTSKPGNLEGFYEARKYLIDVAEYWTEAVQSKLILETAKATDLEKANIAKNNDVDKSKIKIKDMTNDDFPTLKQGKTIEDYVANFPVQSIETSPELSAIFSQPEFRKEFFDTETIFTISEIVSSAIDSSIPEEYKENADYKTYVAKTYANQILRHIFVGAMNPELVKETATRKDLDLNEIRDKITLKSFQKYNPSTVEAERKQVIKAMKKHLSIESTAMIASKMEKELAKISLDDFKIADSIVLQGKGGLNWRFDAAKDITDLESVQNFSIDFKDAWKGDSYLPGTEDFWTDFINNVKKYNPSSYIVAEITDFDKIVPWDDIAAMEAFDPGLTEEFLNEIVENLKLKNIDYKIIEEYLIARKNGTVTPKMVRGVQEILGNRIDEAFNRNGYIHHPMYRKVVNFIDAIGATTYSNYDKYFNALSLFVGVNPEHGYSAWNSGNLEVLKGNIQDVLDTTCSNTLLTHMFTSNHDKPRVLHCIPIRFDIFHEEELDRISADEETWGNIYELIKESQHDTISPKAVAVGLKMQEIIKNADFIKDENRERLLLALSELVRGTIRDENGKILQYSSFKRSQNFGTTPFEITTKDLFKKANINDENMIQSFIETFIGEKSLQLSTSLWEVMSAAYGVPTLFAGDEFGQTGYETFSRNKYVGNRNQVLHQRAYKDGIFKDFYTKISAISNIAQLPGLSAIRNGAAIVLDISKQKDIGFLPIYKYDNKGSKTIQVITNYNVPKQDKTSYDYINQKGNKKVSVPSISITGKNGCPFEDDTILYRKIYTGQKTYETEKINGVPKTYKVKDGKIVPSDSKQINIDDTVLVFYKP